MLKLSAANRKIYSENPKTCKRCGNTISYRMRLKVEYCSRKCSAATVNIKGRIHSEESKQKQSIKMKTIFPHTKVCSKICEGCGNIYIAKLTKRSPFCSECKLHKCPEYRKLCKFDLNSGEYPELYSSELITKYGWYTPPSNPACNYTGVTWDHLYPIHKGFIEKVSPDIMKHPANAELVPFLENLRRYRQQRNGMINLEELKARIEQWDCGNRLLPTFYKDGDRCWA